MRLQSNGPEETFRYGLTLGRLLKNGDTVCLFGDLGSGKTIFVKGIASAFGIPDRDITSASFTIVAEYVGTKGGEIPFYHIDLYRIGNAGELDSIGIGEYIGGDGISVIEWAERIGRIEGAIHVVFTIAGEKEREITIEGINEADWNYL